MPAGVFEIGENGRAGAIALVDDEATRRAGAALGLALSPGDAVMLAGGLGAGKTALARAAIAARLAAAGRRAEEIPSPTFTLVQIYQADALIWHADLYRISTEWEAYELGLDEAFDQAIAFVEWPERLGAFRPARRLEIALSIPADGGRRLDWRCVGEGWERVAAALGGGA
ncbi:MAG: tRNA (adenosine(37)-N6)-threonylcarbamoyltransferase complex ATPase subunit type 1 TsaE [Pikeienuella sp.]